MRPSVYPVDCGKTADRIRMLFPLLFLIFLNDLVELLASAGINVKAFANDMTIYIRVTSNIGVRRLQTAIDLII